jgi:hypothetical protein
MFKVLVQSINKNHLKNQPEKCHEQLTKITVSVKWLKQCQTNIQSTAMLSGENHDQFNIK